MQIACSDDRVGKTGWGCRGGGGVRVGGGGAVCKFTYNPTPRSPLSVFPTRVHLTMPSTFISLDDSGG